MLLQIIIKYVMFKFNDLTHGFCERELYGGNPPEYINSLTALFLTFAGLIGLFASNNTNSFNKIFYACFVLNGIGSFSYHWTNFLGWRYIDEFSMIILSMSALASITNCLINRIFSKFISHIFSISSIVIIFYSIIILVIDSLDDISTFRIGFGLFLLIITIEILILILLNKNINLKILMYPCIGLFLIAISCVMWCITELLCYRYSLIKYIPGHAIWHIGLSFGGYYIAQFIGYISANDLNYYPYFITDTWFNKLYPILNYELL